MALPGGPPPILPHLKSQVEDYLESPHKLPIHDLDQVQQYWPRKPEYDRLVHVDYCLPPFSIEAQRDPSSGELQEFREVYSSTVPMKKTSRPSDKLFKGNVNGVPFWPGGMDWDPLAKLKSLDVENILEELKFEHGLKTVPPGMERGIDFETDSIDLTKAALSLKSKTAGGLEDNSVDQSMLTGDITNLAEVLKIRNLGFEWLSDAKETEKPEKPAEDSVGEEVNAVADELGVLEISSALSLSELTPKSTQWAEAVNINTPVDNFNQLVPSPAFTWSFELDHFQKHAIVHLERGDNVFIAAHTSAGKTVVAEYAIALSQKHGTKAIYTSPIKALSNQKFRDFKDTFADVGLLTGDVQINDKASCLIMTTEILRSMLYNGSDKIPDLEWVIFDEVHYINDSERGVVWEEVLILLPDHVKIVMLSATVPNTMEFATWVGRTKKRKMYVISTPRRPVPLEHYLYTGTTGKTQDERFLILDANGNFIQKGYVAAMDSKKKKEVKPAPAANDKTRGGAKPQSHAHTSGGHAPKAWGPPQEKNLWITVINHLQKQDKLPVVAFTLSRNRCDQNASLLSSVDLMTKEEKGEVHKFFQQCISRLKGSDQKLPQVMKMQDLLKRGIGVHHSGILPILKEVVEMLFQRSLVKVLFATETFAMGVNMPARTVVFDSIRKHDGHSFRNLLPAEYIQMAGRAGRRGKDTTGTVIILCKMDVPEASELHAMMLGIPRKLESQFKVTYSMILNLSLRETFRVEDMMKRSFGELHQQSQQEGLQKQLQQLTEAVDKLPTLSCSICEDIETFYSNAKAYVQLKEEMQDLILTHPQMVKDLTPGRVVVVAHQGSSNKLGILLSVDSRNPKEKLYQVLVLVPETNPSSSTAVEDPGIHVKLQAIVSLGKPPYLPAGKPSHSVVPFKAKSIWEVTKTSVKVEADKIISDWRNRQIPRFSGNPPGPSCVSAVQELLRLSQNSAVPATVNPLKEWTWTDMDLVAKLQDLERLRTRALSANCIDCHLFSQHLEETCSSMAVKEDLQRTRFLLSEESLQLLPEYHARLDVLKALNYIDQSGTIQMKGNVACKMGSHELMITELVFNNVLSDLQPAEIAALLSCLVFQQKNASEAKLTPQLAEGKAKILDIAERIGRVQQECGLKEAVGDFVEQFCFNLTEVVYEWAKGMPFSEIMGLTDVQEGMIVRCIQRLDETLRDVRDASRIIGDSVFYQKMEEARTAIKRDIVFAASLYTVLETPKVFE